MNKKRAADGDILLEEAWGVNVDKHTSLVLPVTLRNKRSWEGNQPGQVRVVLLLFTVLNKITSVCCEI